MTGKDLIKWIHDNNAEDLEIIVEHRDSGGSYHTAEHLGELGDIYLVSFSDESYGVINTIKYNPDKPTAVLL